MGWRMLGQVSMHEIIGPKIGPMRTDHAFLQVRHHPLGCSQYWDESIPYKIKVEEKEHANI